MIRFPLAVFLATVLLLCRSFPAVADDDAYGYFEEAGSGFSPNPKKHSHNAVLTRVQLEF